MVKKNFSVKITDEHQKTQLEEDFLVLDQKFSEKVYTSMTEERLRTNKIIVSKKIAAPLEKVFRVICQHAAADMHPELKVEDLESGAFYQASNKKTKLF